MSDLVELKPCPFCNSAPNPVPQNGDVLPGGNGYFQTIWCERCDAEGGKRKIEADAIEAWNRRAPDPELSRLSALVAEWQDIETAPKDGTPIIGAFWTIRWADSHRRGDIVRCWYQPEFGAFISSAREMTLAPGLTFEDGTSRQIHSPVIEPVTHWLPIPAPPVSQLKDTTNADK